MDVQFKDVQNGAPERLNDHPSIYSFIKYPLSNNYKQKYYKKWETEDMTSLSNLLTEKEAKTSTFSFRNHLRGKMKVSDRLRVLHTKAGEWSNSRTSGVGLSSSR